VIGQRSNDEISQNPSTTDNWHEYLGTLEAVTSDYRFNQTAKNTAESLHDTARANLLKCHVYCSSQSNGEDRRSDGRTKIYF
jgi:hypothetical protein